MKLGYHNLKIFLFAFVAYFIFFISYSISGDFSFEINPGDKINFFANKKNIYDKNGEKIIQAEGNIVIIHQNSTMYGDECLMNFATGQLEVHGNVRLVGQELNLYGTDLLYNAKTKMFSIDNAKLFSVKYSVVAKKIKKIDDLNFNAEEAEFTTCSDCPESWSVFANKIRVTKNEYVRAKNAMLKIKGSDSLYLPYIVFPIKKNRETGLLFPRFGSRINQGFSYEQPFFWNISPYQDMTISPSFSTKRGYGSEIEYRWLYDYNSWFMFDNNYMNDRLYLPNKENDDPSGVKYFRYYHLFDFGFRPSNNLSFQVHYNDYRDLDMYREFNQVLSNKMYAAETGVESFASWRNSFSEANVQILIPNSLLREDEGADRNIFDRDPFAVSTLPKINYDIASHQFNWSKGALFPQVVTNVEFETTSFVQNHFRPELKYRNAQRSIIAPQAKIYWWNGEIVDLSTNIYQSFSHYDFRQEGAKNFDKHQVNGKTTFSFEISKIFGLAGLKPGIVMGDKNEKITQKEIEQEKFENQMLITTLPKWQKKSEDLGQNIPRASYRHVSQFLFSHYYLFEEQVNGNRAFAQQIRSQNGWFDYKDALLDNDYDIASEEFQTTIPTLNTLEFEWKNNLIKKNPTEVDFNKDFFYNTDQFSFNRVASLNFSQGVRLKNRTTNSTFKDSLTRLKTQFTSNLNKYFNVSLVDYYFHINGNHIWNIDVTNDFSRLLLTHSLVSNDFEKRKNYSLKSTYSLNDYVSFGYKNSRDISLGKNLSRSFYVSYASPSKCWQFSVGYTEALEDKQINFDFAFIFGDERTSLVKQ